MTNQWTGQDDERMYELLGVCRQHDMKFYLRTMADTSDIYKCSVCGKIDTDIEATTLQILALNFHNPGEREFLVMVEWCLKRDFYFTISPHNTKGVYCRVETCIFCRAETCIFGPIEVTAETAPLALRDALRAYGGKG